MQVHVAEGRETLKIVQLVTRNCIGGVLGVAQALDRGFRGAGHNSSVWFFCDTDEETVPTPHSRHIFARRAGKSYYPRLLWRLLLQLRRERPDVVIAHTTNTAVPGLLLAALAGACRRVVVQHNPLDTYSTAARSADRLCAELGVYTDNVTVAATVSKTMGAYSRSAARRVRTIHNGMNPPSKRDAASPAEKAELRERLSLPTDRPLIATVGRLAEQKNQGVLIEAMRALDGAALAIAGDGPLRAPLQAKVASAGLGGRIHMLGALDSSKVRMLLRACDAFVTPSHFEAMPMVVLEAMQESCAIVASDIEAHRELLGDAGVLVPGSAEAIGLAVARVLAMPSMRAHLGAAARERAAAFSEEAMVQGYLLMLEDRRA